MTYPSGVTPYCSHPPNKSCTVLTDTQVPINTGEISISKLTFLPVRTKAPHQIHGEIMIYLQAILTTTLDGGQWPAYAWAKELQYQLGRRIDFRMVVNRKIFALPAI